MERQSGVLVIKPVRHKLLFAVSMATQLCFFQLFFFSSFFSQNGKFVAEQAVKWGNNCSLMGRLDLDCSVFWC